MTISKPLETWGLIECVQCTYHIAWNFLYGANFRTFQTHAKRMKIRTYKNIFSRSRDYPILSDTETFRLLQRSRCPCKHGNLISSPWWWKIYTTWVEKFKLAQCVPQGVWLERQKLELQNVIVTENSKLYEHIHQRNFPAIQYSNDYYIVVTIYMYMYAHIMNLNVATPWL